MLLLLLRWISTQLGPTLDNIINITTPIFTYGLSLSLSPSLSLSLHLSLSISLSLSPSLSLSISLSLHLSLSISLSLSLSLSEHQTRDASQARTACSSTTKHKNNDDDELLVQRCVILPPGVLNLSDPKALKMAANFWTSSHQKQLLDQEEVDIVKSLDKDKGMTLEDFKLIKMQMANYISKLAQNIKVRQRVVATAVTYMRRVYVRKSMAECDPRLVAPTCLYLAAKAEESTIQARLLSFYIKKLYSDEKYRYEIKDILEMEMKILEALDYFLVVFHPYRSLSQLLQDAGMNDISMTQITWGLVNDTYKMDLILIYPPHYIALACIYIASVLSDRETTAWFEELRVDINVVKNISMEILDFYDSLESVTDEKINSALNKLTPKHKF